jgi:tetratricopeptide (TPR) repeat protein
MLLTLKNFPIGLFLLMSAVLFVSAIASRAQDDPTAAAIELFNAGQDSHEKGDLKKAVELYQSALKQLPEFPEAEYQLGNALVALERLPEAEKAFRRAVELREDWTLPLAALGSLLVTRGEFTEAETILTRAVEIDDQSFPAYAAIADLRLRMNASPQVLGELLVKIRALTVGAKQPASIWIARASLERAVNDAAAARASISRALALEPNNRNAIAEHAEVSLLSNDPKNAIADARALLKSAPSSARYNFLLARALAANGDSAESLKIIDSVADRSPEMNAFRERLLAAASEDPADLEKRLETDPKNTTVLGRLCGLYRKSDPQKSLDYCRRAYETDDTNIDFVIGFGAALVQAKQFENAVSILGRVLAIAPENFTARANLAVALFQLKRFAESKAQYRWLTERQPDNAIAYFFLGIIHDQLKEYMDAMANYQRFLKLADTEQFKLEIEKVNLRLPGLQKQLKRKE